MARSLTTKGTADDSAAYPEVADPAGGDEARRLNATAARRGEHGPGAAAGCAPRSLWGWSPPPLPAQTRWQRRVDRYLPSAGWPCLAYIAGVVGLLSLAPRLAPRGRLGLDAGAFLAAGGWCALNVWRCRQAHCFLTGAGWLALGLMALLEVGLGHSVIAGYEQPVFLGVLVVGLGFEAAWTLWRRTNALVPRSSARVVGTGWREERVEA